MPDSRSKRGVVARLEQERQLLEETIGSIGPGAMLESGVVGEWSVKDVLAHLADFGLLNPRTVAAHCVWLNPVPEKEWDFTQSVSMVRQLMGRRMFPLTLEGLDRAMRELVR